jgi:hypothetical protein
VVAVSRERGTPVWRDTRTALSNSKLTFDDVGRLLMVLSGWLFPGHGAGPPTQPPEVCVRERESVWVGVGGCGWVWVLTRGFWCVCV